MNEILYTGAFIDKYYFDQLISIAEKYGKGLANASECPHVTLDYKPSRENAHNDWFGVRLNFKIVAYGNNGLNEGFLVEALGEYDLPKLFQAKNKPHITISWSEDSVPARTEDILFVPIAEEDQIQFIATYGAIYIPYTKVEKVETRKILTVYEAHCYWTNEEEYEDSCEGEFVIGTFLTRELAENAIFSYAIDKDKRKSLCTVSEELPSGRHIRILRDWDDDWPDGVWFEPVNYYFSIVEREIMG